MPEALSLTVHDFYDALVALRETRDRRLRLVSDLGKRRLVRGHDPEATKLALAEAEREVERLTEVIERFEAAVTVLS